MFSYAKKVLSVIRYPGRCRIPRIEEEERRGVNVKAFKANLCGGDRNGGRLSINRAIEHGTELHAVFFVEDHAPYGIWV